MSASSSSLAMALVEPKSRKKPSPKAYRAEDSAGFFNNFLSQQSAELKNGRANGHTVQKNGEKTPKRRSKEHSDGSPDPLALTSTTPSSSRKRKAAQPLESPSVRRAIVQENGLNTPRTTSEGRPTPSSNGISAPRVKLEPYIALPPIPRAYQTPKGKGKERAGSDDQIAAFGVDDSPLKSRPNGGADSVRSSGRRATGDRDDRGPVDKLVCLLEDIFEAEDALPPDMSVVDLPSEFFSPLTYDATSPLLAPSIVRKLTNYILKAARPMKRMRLSTRDTSHSKPPSKTRGLANIETAQLSRILRMLERTVRAGEDLDPFGTVRSYTAPVPKSPSKKKAKTASKGDDRRSKSKTPHPEEGIEDDSVPDQIEVTEADMQALRRALDLAKDSIYAADCCLTLLGGERLTKQLYSEELITACLSTVKNQLTRIIYPFVEGYSEIPSQCSPLLRHIIHSSLAECDRERRLLGEVFHALSSVLPHITQLVCAENMAMSESIIIQAVYIAIGPFFVADNTTDGKGREKKDSVVIHTLGQSAMRGLRLEALSLIRSIFANHEDQRSWIIEEILSSLIKLSDTKQKAGQFRLRDGRSIRTVSALLLQLVQTSAHDVHVEAEALRDSRLQALALHRQDSATDSQATFLDEKDMEELRLYTSGLDSATRAAKTIIAFLTQRSGKTKTTKNANEAEYRSIFDSLIADLLTVLFWPEWPAAAVLLGVASKFMISSLDDVKTTSQNENNAAKTMALEHLGVIAARLRTCDLRKKEVGEPSGALKCIDEIADQLDVEGLEKVLDAHQDLSAYLLTRASEDQAFGTARELAAVIVGEDLAKAVKQCAKQMENAHEDESPKPKLLEFGNKVKAALQDIWNERIIDVFDSGVSQEETTRMDRVAEHLGITQGLRHYFNPILNVVLTALDAPPVFMRTKALKALGQILTSDPTILGHDDVRRSIESHLLDSSPAVRDAAVELIGKYIVDFPHLAGKYYRQIAERIADTGLGVRKRVIKLMKSIYGVTKDRKQQVDICQRMICRMLDEDDTVKDLACKTIEELWFQDAPGPTSREKSTGPAISQDKTQLLRKVSIIMEVSGGFKDRNSPLEDLLHKIMSEKSDSEKNALHRRYTDICECLIDGLVDASDLPEFTVVNCVRTIYLFTSAYPAVLSASNAQTLLPYLKNASTPEDQIISDYLLRIFRSSIPHLPKTAKAFGQELQTALQPMILKPSTASGIMGLQETVACLCAVVQHLTLEFKRLVSLLRSCSSRLLALGKSSAEKISPQDSRALPILILIVALLCEHCNFDQLRTDASPITDDTLPEIRADLTILTPGPINEYIYGLFLRLYDRFSGGALRGRILLCLGFLFRAQPALLTAEPSSRIMDDIFSSSDEEARGRLLKIMQDFLVSEAEKHANLQKEKAMAGVKSSIEKVNMQELVGNTDGFAESGVSSAVVQRYLQHILAAALSQNAQIQAAAVDILTFTIKQGLAHPLQCFPIIVALETSASNVLSGRANTLHGILHSKHTSLLNAKYVASARTSFDYQKKMSRGQIFGYRMLPNPTALLHRWYSLVRDKRATRQDFLRALVKVFDVELVKSTQDDIDFVRYMAENFASFEYKTQEEVLTVLKYLTSILSTSGMQLVEALSPAHLLKQLHEPSQPEAQVESSAPPAFTSEEFAERLPLVRSSVIIAIIMMLKAHLKTLYGISEDKCAKWVIGKKTAVGDRQAGRRHEKPLTWDRLPYATSPILSSQDLTAQRDKFLEIWSEDGVTGEPEEDSFE
ncbi:sister chromatid cohesion protein-like protein [Phanerochaete sordida]|uniref:Sister chromatid cohesion protein n=1 Tax=Phanerochaete sordida TaxID=48140 RepID=A0A9P3GKG0_9APHY|nr:sister chromatid cohesion protein-like protein [Phanerochaete sordida]